MKSLIFYGFDFNIFKTKLSINNFVKFESQKLCREYFIAWCYVKFSIYNNKIIHSQKLWQIYFFIFILYLMLPNYYVSFFEFIIIILLYDNMKMLFIIVRTYVKIYILLDCIASNYVYILINAKIITV